MYTSEKYMSKQFTQLLKDKLDTGELLSIVDRALSATQAVLALGYSNNGKYVKLIRDFVLDNEIDTLHWTSNGLPKAKLVTKTCPVCSSIFEYSFRSDKPGQVTCSVGCANTYFRSGENNPNWNGGRRYRERALQLLPNSCVKCGYDNILALEVHHIDKDRSNNDISNLRILCANCHTIEHKEK